MILSVVSRYTYAITLAPCSPAGIHITVFSIFQLYDNLGTYVCTLIGNHIRTRDAEYFQLLVMVWYRVDHYWSHGIHGTRWLYFDGTLTRKIKEKISSCGVLRYNIISVQEVATVGSGAPRGALGPKPPPKKNYYNNFHKYSTTMINDKILYITYKKKKITIYN